MRGLILVLLVSVVSCSGVKSMYARYSYDFVVSDKNEKIHYEPGMEELAKLTMAHMAGSLADVASAEYLPFRNLDRINVYIFSDYERYSTFSNSNGGRASSSRDDIFISPKLLSESHNLPGILRHELSHIHLRQYLGSSRYVYAIPAWFKEGVAVVTSGGFGAERVSEQEAISSILSGQHFNPEEGVGMFRQKRAHDSGLKPQMFYHQAGLFIGFLQDINASAFEKCYRGIVSGEEFADVWEKYYGKTIVNLWREFVAKIAG